MSLHRATKTNTMITSIRASVMSLFKVGSPTRMAAFYKARDLWTQEEKSMSGSWPVSLPAAGSTIWRVTKQ